jgi:hypothetical protein
VYKNNETKYGVESIQDILQEDMMHDLERMCIVHEALNAIVSLSFPQYTILYALHFMPMFLDG